MLEMVFVLVIAAALAAMAIPSWQRVQADARLKEAARDVANAFQFARSQAILTERNHIVYFTVRPGQDDICGTALPAPVVVVDDSSLVGANNCCLDAGELVLSEPALPGVNWGLAFAPVAAPQDNGQSPATFPPSTMAQGVIFRPDGVPVSFDNVCTLGQIGTGGGGVYITNQARDYGVVLSPLGGAKIHAWDRSQNLWTN